ncbi:hypothetical protein [Guyparkeria sp. TX1]|uniref:hypothetical protein n=1 Tax=Guyparkeria sp. TX1 TaxID=3115001 RepID=UPI003977C593
MKTALISVLIIAASALLSTAHTESKFFPIEAFESETIPLYSPEGSFIEEVSTESLGAPQKVAVLGFDKRGFALIEHKGSPAVIDPAFIKLKESYTKKALIKCAEVNREKDNQYATSMGFGDCI